jgi:type IV secretion system protein VirB10
MCYRIIILFLSFAAFLGTVLAQNLDGVILPAKTDIFVRLQRSINSKTVSPGDKFSTLVEVPVTQDDRIVIPVGSYLLGHVASKETAGYVEGKANLVLVFDTVILRNGVTRQLRAHVQSAEGYESNPESEEGELVAGGSQGEEVAVGAATGAVIGLVTAGTAHVFSRGHPRAFEIGPAIGAAGGALLGLLKKGEEVELRRGASLTIQLQDEVEFVKPRARAQNQSLNSRP